MFSDKIGFMIGIIIGRNNIGNINDLFLANIEKADIIVPQIDKFNVGSKIPKKIKRNILIFSIEGTEMKKANNRMMNSVKLNMK